MTILSEFECQALHMQHRYVPFVSWQVVSHSTRHAIQESRASGTKQNQFENGNMKMQLAED